MLKEWKMLLSGWWQFILYLLIFAVLVAMSVSFTTDGLLASLERKDFAALEGAYDTQKVDQIVEKYGSYDLQRGSNQFSYGAEQDPHLVLERFYGDSYTADRERLMKISEEKPEATEKAEQLLENLRFLYSNNWKSYFDELASAAPSVPLFSFFTVALILLGATLLSAEYQQGTWLVIGNTVLGRHGILLKKFFVLSLTGVLTILLVHIFSLLNLSNGPGSIIYAGRHVSEMWNTVPFWDPSLLGAALLNIVYWMLAIPLLVSILLLISAIVKRGLLSIIISILYLIGLPCVLRAVLPIRPLCFPQNLVGMVQVLLSPGIEHDRLVQFLAWRPWLPALPAVVMLYTLLLPVIFTALFLALTNVIVKRWY